MAVQRPKYNLIDKAIHDDNMLLEREYNRQLAEDIEKGGTTTASGVKVALNVVALGFGLKFAKNLEKQMLSNNKLNYDLPDKYSQFTYDTFQFDKGVKLQAEEISRAYKLSVGNVPTGYRNIADSLVDDVVSGKKTLKQAKREFTRTMRQQGYYNVTTLSGNRQMRADAWFRMHARTQNNKLYMENQERYMNTNGYDVIIVSKHTHRKPREGCAPWENTLLSIGGLTTEIIDLNGKTHRVIPRSQSSYGEPAGIFGINCTHSSTIAVPGKFII